MLYMSKFWIYPDKTWSFTLAVGYIPVGKTVKNPYRIIMIPYTIKGIRSFGFIKFKL
jgi:hypothetical protein